MAHLPNPLHAHYPLTHAQRPLIVAAPMMRLTMAPLAVAVTRAGGLGWIPAGFETSGLPAQLRAARALCREDDRLRAWMDENGGTLPVGVGFQNWGCDLEESCGILEREGPVCAVWFFGARRSEDYAPWAERVRELSRGKTRIWVQLGSVQEAVDICRAAKPDVLVVQGGDAGGHGLKGRAGIVTLLPEVIDRLESEGLRRDGTPAVVGAGGIVDGRSVAALLALGAQGAVLGTRFLACEETQIAKGYQEAVLRAGDGGVNTVKSTVYDSVRGITGWPAGYDARGAKNETYADFEKGMSDEENRRLYDLEVKKGDEGWGTKGRMTTYAGTGVGLVKDVKSAKDIVDEVGTQAMEILTRTAKAFQ